MKIVEIEKVFTPGSPAELTYIERPKPSKQIKRAIRNNGIQIIVYGHSGSGKTTLLYNLLNEIECKHIITRCTKGISIKDVLYDGFSQLGSFYSAQKETTSEDKLSAGFKFGLNFFSFGINGETKQSKGEVSKRLVEIQKNPNLLAKLFGASECLWVIEDFHKLDTEPKKELSQIMKVFMDVASDYPKTKIIAIGATDTARQVVNLDKEMEQRVSEVYVPLMTSEQLFEIISLGEIHLNINLETGVQEKIVAYSSGLASVTHTLCSLACESKKIFKTQRAKVKINKKDLEYAVNEYVSEKSDTLKSVFEQATKEKAKRKYESPERILEAILKLDKDSFSILEISDQFARSLNSYKPNNLRKYVMELTTPERGEILRYNQNADSFTFSSPFLRGYCHIQLIKYPSSKESKTHKKHQNADLLKEYLNVEFQKFVEEFTDEIYEY